MAGTHFGNVFRARAKPRFSLIIKFASSASWDDPAFMYVLQPTFSYGPTNQSSAAQKPFGRLVRSSPICWRGEMGGWLEY